MEQPMHVLIHATPDEAAQFETDQGLEPGSVIALYDNPDALARMRELDDVVVVRPEASLVEPPEPRLPLDVSDEMYAIHLRGRTREWDVDTNTFRGP
jgi:hypothetical protein